MKPSFQTQMDRTGTDVGQITCWCITIALHQEFGVGRKRLDQISDRMTELENENMALLMTKGAREADALREGWLKGYGDPHFRVTMLRAPRGRKEQQFKIAGDNAASLAWQIYAKGCIDVLHFGGQRLEKLKTENWKNYEQFNGWANHDGLEVALEMLKRCAEDALQDKLKIVEDYKESDAQTKEVEREIRQVAESRARLNITVEAARAAKTTCVTPPTPTWLSPEDAAKRIRAQMASEGARLRVMR